MSEDKIFTTRKDAFDWRAMMQIGNEPEAWNLEIVKVYNSEYIETSGGWIYKLKRLA